MKIEAGMGASNPHQFSGQKILVTGASGFIGTHLCKELNGRGGKIHAVSRQTRRADVNEVSWWRVDLKDTKGVENLLMAVRPDLIYHLASLVTGSRDLDVVIPTFNSNLLTTVNLLSTASRIGCKRFLLIGSMEEPVSSSPEVLPGYPYAAAKWASSAYGRMFHALYQLPVVIPRIFMVYGEGQRNLKQLIPYVTLSLLRGETPRVSSGKRKMDWIHIEDVVQGLIAAARAKNIEGQTIDIGSGELISVRTVVGRLVHIINPKIEPQFGALEDRSLEQERVADIARSNSLMGWKPTISMADGLKRTVDWYRAAKFTVTDPQV